MSSPETDVPEVHRLSLNAESVANPLSKSNRERPTPALRLIPTLTMPELSVVIASVKGDSYLYNCLESLSHQKCAVDAEVIVVDRSSNGTAAHIRERFPNVTVVKAPVGTGIPELRAMGIEKSHGKIVAISQDHCVMPDNWFDEILKAHKSSYAAIGGAVEIAGIWTLIEWASFLCEYSEAMLPLYSGEVERVTGNNVAYKREALDRIDKSTLRGCWEYFVHDEMRRNGDRLLSLPSLVVSHRAKLGFMKFLTQRYYYSKSFAAMRRKRMKWHESILSAILTPALPPIILFRIARNVIRKKRFIRQLVLSSPYLVVFLLAYAAGESCGYLFGTGNSLSKVD
jgi:glycosyltransferase involved in cell wall biosynthesis